MKKTMIITYLNYDRNIEAPDIVLDENHDMAMAMAHGMVPSKARCRARDMVPDKARGVAAGHTKDVQVH